MPNIHIVTDSSATFIHPQFIRQSPVTVVPNKIEINGKSYREGQDISTEEALTLISRQETAPKVIPPTVEDYFNVYSNLIRTNDAIISIHASKELFNSWEHARLAAQQMGHVGITVIDSTMLCVAQGLMVELAVKAVHRQEPLDTIVKLVRGAIERSYAMYYVEDMDYLQQNQIISPSHRVLGAMLGVKPLLTIEEGKLHPIEKVKTRSQAVEHLVEYVVEFTDIEDAVILQGRTRMTEQTRIVQDRLGLEFPKHTFPYTLYAASLAALIGARASGVVVLEAEMEDYEDDF